MTRRVVRMAAVALVAMLAGSAMAQPVSSAFTYQGRLIQGGVGPTALYDFQFRLFDLAAGGSQQGGTVTLLNTQVTGGLFTVNLDFGNQYNGNKRWLQIEVRNAGGVSYTVLSPRQELTATPHAQALAFPVNENVGSSNALITLNNSGAGDGLVITTAGGATTAGGVYTSAGGNNSNGVVAIANNGSAAYGVWATSSSGYGVVGGGVAAGGSFFGNVGVTASSGQSGSGGIGVQGSGGSGNIGVRGDSSAGGGGSFGVYGASSDVIGNGVYGECNNGSSAYGVWGSSSTGYGVVGGGAQFGGDFSGGTGVRGTGSGASSTAGVHGVGGSSAFGVLGDATAGGTASYGGSFTSTATSGNGVAGTCNVGGAAWGVVGTSSTGQAGHFAGAVQVVGNLSKSSGSFEIDHPLDPANKYLYHSFVESPDMMNIYNGNVRLDGNGTAVVTMPDWFEALNTEFRYQLTAMGAPGPNLYIAQEIKNGQFAIAGGMPGGGVSWQVTGIRHDAWANAHRIQAEVVKPPEQRGRYLHPELYGLPESFNVYAEKLAGLNNRPVAQPDPVDAAKRAQPAPAAPAIQPMKGGR